MHKSKRMLAVEAEYDLPFWDVVQGYAQDGYSVTATAALLDYASASAFSRLITRHGKGGLFPNGHTSLLAVEARKHKQVTARLRAALTKASSANPCYVRVEYRGQHGTLADHSRRLGIPVKTVYNRHQRRPGEWDYIFSKRSHVHTPNNTNHPWKDSCK